MQATLKHGGPGVLVWGWSLTANSGTKAAVLPKDSFSTANPGTKVAVLLGMNRCGSFPLLSEICIQSENYLNRQTKGGLHGTPKLTFFSNVTFSCELFFKFSTGLLFSCNDWFVVVPVEGTIYSSVVITVTHYDRWPESRDFTRGWDITKMIQ